MTDLGDAVVGLENSPGALRRQAEGWRFLSLLFAASPDEARLQQGRAFLSAFGADPGDESGEEIREDYLRLFSGLRKTLAPPWESVYLSPGRRVFQEPALAVRRAYLEAALAHDQMFQVPDDHLSLELEFVASLAARAAAAQESGDTAEADRAAATQRQFVAEHLGRWVSAFADDVRLHARTEFWRGAAAVLRALFPPGESVPGDVAAGG